MADAIHPNPQDDLMNALSALHLSGKYSDLMIACNYKQWAVHKAIVCSRSGFFDGACSNQFREAGSGVIDLSQDDEEAVEQMIHFFYRLDYLNEPERQPTAVFRHRTQNDARRRLPKKLDLSMIEDPLLAQAGYCAPHHSEPSPPQTPADSVISINTNFSNASKMGSKSARSPIRARDGTPPLEDDASDSDADSYDEEYEGSDAHLLLHTRVYALAEKYDIPSLKQLAQGKFEMAMACYYDSPEFAEAIEEVYSSTVDSDRGLRDIVLQAFRSHPRLASTQDVFAVIKETPTLAFELFKIERGLPI